MPEKNKRYKSLKYVMIVTEGDKDVKTVTYKIKRAIKKEDVLLINIDGNTTAELSSSDKDKLPDDIKELLSNVGEIK